MYSVDLAANAWRNLSGGLQGAAPSRRAYHAVATAGQTVYLFGGSHPAGEPQAAAAHTSHSCCIRRPFISPETQWRVAWSDIRRSSLEMTLPPSSFQVMIRVSRTDDARRRRVRGAERHVRPGPGLSHLDAGRSGTGVERPRAVAEMRPRPYLVGPAALCVWGVGLVLHGSSVHWCRPSANASCSFVTHFSAIDLPTRCNESASGYCEHLSSGCLPSMS